jgi:hypothetical protein
VSPRYIGFRLIENGNVVMRADRRLERLDRGLVALELAISDDVQGDAKSKRDAPDQRAWEFPVALDRPQEVEQHRGDEGQQEVGRRQGLLHGQCGVDVWEAEP